MREREREIIYRFYRPRSRQGPVLPAHERERDVFSLYFRSTSLHFSDIYFINSVNFVYTIFDLKYFFSFWFGSPF